MGDATSPTSHEGVSPRKGGPAALLITANRVKNLVKEDTEIKPLSGDACFALGKATELFLESIAAKAAAHMQVAGRDAALEYSDVAAVVAETEALDFLQDIIPQTVKAAALLPAMS
ncbi:Nuclear transcription factor Y subunit C-6 [Chlorella vulgaris]